MNEIENRISSKEVAEMMEMDHKHLLEKIDKINEDFGSQKIGYEKYWEEGTFENRGKQYREFQISKHGCEFLAHKTTGTKGNLFTDKYMDKFALMEKKLSEPIINSHFLFQVAAQLQEKEKQISLMKPKCEFYDDVAGSKDAIEMADASKVLAIKGYGRNNLFEFLRKKKILQPDNIPYQTYIDRGYFRTIEQKYTTSDGETRINIKTLVYQRGLEFIRKLLKGAA